LEFAYVVISVARAALLVFAKKCPVIKYCFLSYNKFKMVVKSSYTFKVMPGQTCKWQIECFYFNQSSKIIESISPCSQSTPKHLKRAFGPISAFHELDSETIEIENDRGERIQLLSSRLTPVLDTEDSSMKKTLISVIEKGVPAIVSALCELVITFKSHLKEDSSCQSLGITRSDTEPNESSCVGGASQESGFVSQDTLSQEVGESTTKSTSICNITKMGPIFSESSSNRVLSVKISEVSSLYDEGETSSGKNSEENFEVGNKEDKPEVTEKESVKVSDMVEDKVVKNSDQVDEHSDVVCLEWRSSDNSQLTTHCLTNNNWFGAQKPVLQTTACETAVCSSQCSVVQWTQKCTFVYF
jgi:hypothetical protein